VKASSRSGGWQGATLFPIIIAGLLAAMTYWLNVASRPPPVELEQRNNAPDSIIQNFEVRRYDSDGVLLYTLRARQLIHYPGEETSVVDAPDLTHHRTPPTHITARTGRVLREGDHIELVDDVRIERSAQGNTPATVLTTTRLDVFPDEEIASNREPVLIVQGQSQVHGIGIHTNNVTGIHVLDGPVRGIFHRERTTP